MMHAGRITMTGAEEPNSAVSDKEAYVGGKAPGTIRKVRRHRSRSNRRGGVG